MGHIRQDVYKRQVLTASGDKETAPQAQAFYDFLLSEEAQEVMSESLDGAVAPADQTANS